MANAPDLLTLLYAELRKLARARLAAGARPTLLDTHALVHESYLRMQRAGQLELGDREHFLAYAAATMRSIVVDFVRRRRAQRRGGEAARVTLDTEVAESLGVSDEEILEVHDALEQLAGIDERLVRIVEMRYFAGLSDQEVAEALGISDRTVRRDWERARLLLVGMLGR
ncbi:MAG: sigma-70 family RNA polymerase sigma factor [Proteobacteria bacterium]|nr:sigma-70 family RNA polymerase sigma factor [Pseudomonadota bacterium]